MLSKDEFSFFSEVLPTDEKLKKVFGVLNERLNGAIERIGIALYDEQANMVKTYTSVDQSESPLFFYETSLEHAPGLKEMKERRQNRVIDDMTIFTNAKGLHTRKIALRGFLSSFTFPMYREESFLGFIFLNAERKNFFTDEIQPFLAMVCHLITDMIHLEILTMKTMVAAFRSANTYIHFKDPETGEHLDRMARYCKMIALEMARNGEIDFSDRQVEFLFMFSPLHDIGKIAIPDRILLKPGSLNEEERKIMETHTTHGKRIIDNLIETFQLEVGDHTKLIHEVVELHHELLDGSGYPHGLSGNQVPVCARIVTVSDIFDALTSERPYKKAWSNEDAFTELDKLVASGKIDKRCVRVLKANQTEVKAIQKQFCDKSVK